MSCCRRLRPWTCSSSAGHDAGEGAPGSRGAGCCCTGSSGCGSSAGARQGPRRRRCCRRGGPCSCCWPCRPARPLRGTIQCRCSGCCRPCRRIRRCCWCCSCMGTQLARARTCRWSSGGGGRWWWLRWSGRRGAVAFIALHLFAPVLHRAERGGCLQRQRVESGHHRCCCIAQGRDQLPCMVGSDVPRLKDVLSAGPPASPRAALLVR